MSSLNNKSKDPYFKSRYMSNTASKDIVDDYKEEESRRKNKLANFELIKKQYNESKNHPSNEYNYKNYTAMTEPIPEHKIEDSLHHSRRNSKIKNTNNSIYNGKNKERKKSVKIGSDLNNINKTNNTDDIVLNKQFKHTLNNDDILKPINKVNISSNNNEDDLKNKDDNKNIGNKVRSNLRSSTYKVQSPGYSNINKLSSYSKNIFNNNNSINNNINASNSNINQVDQLDISPTSFNNNKASQNNYKNYDLNANFGHTYRQKNASSGIKEQRRAKYCALINAENIRKISLDKNKRETTTPINLESKYKAFDLNNNNNNYYNNLYKDPKKLKGKTVGVLQVDLRRQPYDNTIKAKEEILSKLKEENKKKTKIVIKKKPKVKSSDGDKENEDEDISFSEYEEEVEEEDELNDNDSLKHLKKEQRKKKIEELDINSIPVINSKFIRLDDEGKEVHEEVFLDFLETTNMEENSKKEEEGSINSTNTSFDLFSNEEKKKAKAKTKKINKEIIENKNKNKTRRKRKEQPRIPSFYEKLKLLMDSKSRQNKDSNINTSHKNYDTFKLVPNTYTELHNMRRKERKKLYLDLASFLNTLTVKKKKKRNKTERLTKIQSINLDKVVTDTININDEYKEQLFEIFNKRKEILEEKKKQKLMKMKQLEEEIDKVNSAKNSPNTLRHVISSNKNNPHVYLRNSNHGNRKGESGNSVGRDFTLSNNNNNFNNSGKMLIEKFDRFGNRIEGDIKNTTDSNLMINDRSKNSYSKGKVGWNNNFVSNNNKTQSDNMVVRKNNLNNNTNKSNNDKFGTNNKICKLYKYN